MRLFLIVMLVASAAAILGLFYIQIRDHRRARAAARAWEAAAFKTRPTLYRVLDGRSRMLAESGPGLPECSVPILPAPIRKAGVDHIVEGASLLWCQTGCRQVAMPLRCFVPPGSTCEHGVTAPSI